MSNPLVKYLFTAVISACVFCLDQGTKIFIHTQISMEESKTVIEGFFNIVYVRNSGGAFGLFESSHEVIRFILFLFFPLVCVGFVFMMLRETKNRFPSSGFEFCFRWSGWQLSGSGSFRLCYRFY